MKVTATSHKAGGAGLGAAIAAIIVWLADQQGLDMGAIGDAIAVVICAVIGTWFAPANRPRAPKP